MARAIRVFAALAAATTIALATVQPAAAATVTSTPSPSWNLNGRVYASAIVGNEIILGGQFTTATSPSGTVVARENLAAFNATTGELLTGFSADTNNTVRALTSDGTTLYVGGYFTKVKGVSRNRLAAVNPTTGALVTTFSASVNGPVMGLDVKAGRLFVSGAFSTVAGVARSRVAAVNAISGMVDPLFAPSSDATVNAIRATSDGTTVYLGGEFTQISGTARTGVAQVNGLTGALSTVVFAFSPALTLGLDLSTDGSTLLVAGGGTNNSGAAWNTTTGHRLWTTRTDGDVQAIHYYDGDAFFGFHDGFQANPTTKLIKANATTGVRDMSFVPVFNGFWGCFTIIAGAGYVTVGGEFTKIGGVNAGDWARFPIQSA